MTRAALALSWLMLVFGSPASAEDAATPASDPTETAAPAPDAGWQFAFSPYIWFVGLHGTVDAGDASADINVNFDDIWDALDVAVLAAAEARNGRFSLATNLIYMKMSADAEHPVGLLPVAAPGDFSVRGAVQEIMWEVRPFWEVASLPLFSDQHRIALDLGPGVRYFWLDSHLDVKLRPGVPVGPFQRRFDSRTNWADWLGVARVRAQLTDNINVVVSGDWGGWDIGSSSHKTWSVTGFAMYKLGEHWDLSAGWRKIDVDRGDVDLSMSGPLLGAVYNF
jgi:hypothetical protein